MSHSFVAKSLCTGALAVVACTGALSTAHAAVYRGNFTPIYGTPFPDLYWNGSIEVFAPDQCVPGIPQSVFIASCTGMRITGAAVNLYNKSDKHALLQTMDFAAEADGQLNGLNWQLDFGANEELTGAKSTAFPAMKGAINETIYLGDQAWFSLQFLGNFAQLYWFDKEPGTTSFLGIPDEVTLTAGATIGNRTIGGACRINGTVDISKIGLGFLGSLDDYVKPDFCGWSDPDEISAGAFITFEKVRPSEVPEPTTYALVPAALAALGLVSLLSRRRRRFPALQLPRY